MANKFSAKSGSSFGGKIKTSIIVGAIMIIANPLFIPAVKAQSLPGYDQFIKSLPAPAQSLGNTVKQTITNAQTPPSSQNIDSKSIAKWVSGALNWIAIQFKDLTGITFSNLFSTIINFFVWLIKIIIGIVMGVINFVSSFTKK